MVLAISQLWNLLAKGVEVLDLVNLPTAANVCRTLWCAGQRRAVGTLFPLVFDITSQGRGRNTPLLPKDETEAQETSETCPGQHVWRGDGIQTFSCPNT